MALRIGHLVLITGLLLQLQFLVGSLGAINSIISQGVGVALLIYQSFITIYVWSSYERHWKSLPLRVKWLFRISLFAIVASLIGVAVVPVTYRDALIHHLFVPRYWIENSTVGGIWWHVWSSYPQLLNLGFIEPVRWGLPELAALFHLSFLLILAYVVSRDSFDILGNIVWGTLAAGLVLLNPAAFRHASFPIVDIALAAFCYLALSWGLREFSDRKSSRGCFVLGLLLGFSCAIKPNGYVCSLIIGSLLLLKFQRTFLLKFPWILFGGLVAVVPWWIRAYLLTGNPFFPMLRGIFGPQHSEVLQVSLPPLQHRILIYGESILEVLALPVRVFFEGQWHNPVAFDGVLLFVFILALFPFRYIRQSPHLSAHYIFVLVYFLITLICARARVRYFAPIYGSFALLTIVSLFHLYQSKKQISRVLSCVLLILAFLQGGVGLIDFFKERQPIFYFTSGISKSDYVGRHISDAGMIRRFTDILPEDSKTYLLYTSNFYFLYDRQVLSGGHYSESLLYEQINRAESAKALFGALSKMGLTHFIVEEARYLSTFLQGLPEEKQQVWRNFLKDYVRPVEQYLPGNRGRLKRRRSYGLYKLMESSSR